MTSLSPVVSVVIPVFNGARFVRSAIESVFAQTHRPIEVIVVDDGSTDDSVEVIAPFDEVILLRQQNRGVGAARNRAIERSTGEFIAFLDQDDWWFPDKLKQQLDVFAQDERIGLVHTAVSYFNDASGRFVGLLNPEAHTDELIDECFDRLILGNGLYNSSVAVRRSLLSKVGTCDLSIPGNTVQDYDLWLRCARTSRFGHLKTALTVLRLHPRQGLWDRVAMLSAELELLLRHRPFSEWLRTPERRQRLARLHDALAVAYLDSGDGKNARTHFAQAWQAAPSGRQLFRWGASLLPRFAIETFRGGSAAKCQRNSQGVS